VQSPGPPVARATHPHLSRAAVPGMKILVVTTRSPFPLIEGRALRSYNLIKQLSLAHEVHLLSFVQSPMDIAGLEHMRGLCARVESQPLYLRWPRLQLLGDAVRELWGVAPLQVVKYRSLGMRRALSRLLAKEAYDLVHLDMLHLAEYRALCAELPTVLMEHNVESVILARRAETESRWWARRYLQYQERKLHRFEAAACAAADQVVAVSAQDASVLGQMSGREVANVPNGVDTEFFQPRLPCTGAIPGAGLVYVGGFSWFPNVDAVRNFVEQILPLILEHRPDVTLTVIGPGQHRVAGQSWIHHPQLRLVGLVEDIRPWVDEAAVYIVPLRIGGGTRLKILDAMAMSKAVVSTSVGCEGLAVTAGDNILVADSPREFAAHVLQLLEHPDEAQRLGRCGRQFVEQHHEWPGLAARLTDVYQAAVVARAATP
jgi:polysaccharide biosynthesis protein PslH